MSCERCGGLMVIEAICELMDGGSRKGVDTTRCLNCGNFEDTIIRTNRDIARLPERHDPHIVGATRLRAAQPSVSQRTIHIGRVPSKYPRGRAPRRRIGNSSLQTQMLDAERIEPGHSP